MTDDVLKYWAFLSYSQQDNQAKRPDAQDVDHLCWGDWLHNALKNFSVPTEFVGQINGRGEMTPERIEPIFQDEQEQPGDASLSAEVRAALEQSKCLVVVCSPRSAGSLHVNEAVRYFKQLGRGKNIFPIVIAGEPNASLDNKPGIPPEAECFVPALRHPLQPDGTLDTTRRPAKHLVVDARHGATKREILANDHRNAEADLEMAKIHLIAVLLGVAFNGLWWREQKRHFIDLAEAQHQSRKALEQVTEARRQLEAAQQQTREAQNRVLEAQNLPRDVHSQIQEAQTKALEAENRAREAQQQLQEFQNRARETQSQLEEARDRIIAAENKFREAQNQVLETRQQSGDIQRQLEEARNQVQAAPAEIQEAQRQAAETRRQLEEAQNQIQQAQTQAQAQLQEARAQAEAAQNQAAEAKRQAEAASRQVQEIQSQSQQAQAQVQPTRTEADETRGQIEAAQLQVRQARRMTTVLALVTLIALLATGAAWWQRKITGQPLTKPEESSDQAQGRLDQEGIKQALQKFAAVQSDTNQLRSLDELAVRIPTNEIPGALKISSVISDDAQRRHFQTAVLDHWLKTDLTGALNWVRQLPDADSRNQAVGEIIPELVASDSTNVVALLDDFKPTSGKDADDQTFNTILTAWVGKQPDAALDWVKALPDSESKNKALETCIDELTKTDAPKALALATSFPEGNWRNTVIAGVFTTWATNDLAAATAACQQLPDNATKAKVWESILSQRIEKDPATAADDVKNLPPGDFRQSAFEQLCDRWGSTNAPAALAWAQSLPSAAEQTAVTNMVVAFWAGKEPQAAMQFSSQHPELSGDVIMAIAEAYSQSDFAAATNWFASLPNGEKKDAALLGLARAWVQTDPKSMAVYALGLPAGDTQTRYLTVACRLLAKNDLPGTVEILKPLADAELKQTILEQVGSDFEVSHMDQAAKSISTLAAGDEQKALIKGLLPNWTPADPEAAANWLGSFPETNSQAGPLQSVIRSWSQSEPSAVARWLATLPAGTNYEASVSNFLESTVDKYPEFAGQWTQSVTNAVQRQKYQAQVAAHWMQTDPAAALQWIKQQNPPAEPSQPN